MKPRNRTLDRIAQGDVVAAGGEDDCVSLFSIAQRTILARCVGHRWWWWWWWWIVDGVAEANSGRG